MPDIFSTLPDSAPLWIYPSPDPLEADQRDELVSRLESFLPGWNSHGQPVRGRYTIVENRFVLLSAESNAGISGCAIDSSVELFKRLRDETGLDLLDRGRIFYRSEGRLESATIPEFSELVARSRIAPATPVFDTSLSTLGELRHKGLEQAFADCWHSRLFAASPA